MEDEIREALDRGRALFNRREFFEAHEVWEEVWRESEGAERHLLQGLIQVAAGFYKLQVGMPTGTVKLLIKGAGHLREVPEDTFYGLDIPPLIAAADQWREIAKEMVEAFRTDYDPDALPSLDLRD